MRHFSFINIIRYGLLAPALLAGCTGGMNSATIKSNTTEQEVRTGPGSQNPGVPSTPPATTATMTIVNFRQCSPVDIPGLYNTRTPSVASIAPAIKIYSTFTPGTAGYSVNPNLVRTIHFEKRLNRMANGKFELVNNGVFNLTLPRAAAEAITQAQAEGQTIVASIEEASAAPLYSSSVGLPGHGPVPNPPRPAGASALYLPQTNLLPANVAVMQVGTILKSGHNQFGDDECDAEGDPLVIDFSGMGFRTVAPSVSFDLSNTGMFEVFGWIAPNSQQGFLALDVNNNGKIDNGSELFSNFMKINSTTYATNGFEALKSYDRAERGGNNDRRITSQDAVYYRLKIWMDRNSNGITDANELYSLASMGVVSIDLNYVIDARTDQNGNKIIGESTVQLMTGGVRAIADLWFRRL